MRTKSKDSNQKYSDKKRYYSNGIGNIESDDDMDLLYMIEDTVNDGDYILNDITKPDIYPLQNGLFYLLYLAKGDTFSQNHIFSSNEDYLVRKKFEFVECFFKQVTINKGSISKSE